MHSEWTATRTSPSSLALIPRLTTCLYEQLFDENESSLSNLLDVYVSNVRRKLGHDLIVTRRGLGYSME